MKENYYEKWKKSYIFLNGYEKYIFLFILQIIYTNIYFYLIVLILSYVSFWAFFIYYQ